MLTLITHLYTVHSRLTLFSDHKLCLQLTLCISAYTVPIICFMAYISTILRLQKLICAGLFFGTAGYDHKVVRLITKAACHKTSLWDDMIDTVECVDEPGVVCARVIIVAE